MYGPAAANPLNVVYQDWAGEQFTATEADQIIAQHPPYGLPPGMATLTQKGLLFASTETAPQFGGYVEGALEAAQAVRERLTD